MKTNQLSPTSFVSEQEEEYQTLDSIAERTDHSNKKYSYTVVGLIEEVYNNGRAKVTFEIEKEQYSYEAMTTQALKVEDEQKEALLSFNQGELSQPIITGIIQPIYTEPMVLSSEEGIVLECGDSRIVLDPQGTLELKARHIHSQAYGPYRIKGGSVKIN